jgi:hypothetical protein
MSHRRLMWKGDECMSMQRLIRRNIVRNSVYEKKENHGFNLRKFHAVWQKIQIKKFGSVRNYIKMRIASKSRNNELDVTIHA